MRLANLFRMPELVQVDIDGPGVEVAYRKRMAADYPVSWRRFYEANVDFANADAGDWVVPMLEPVLDDLFRRMDSRVFPVQVYLPDPLVHAATLMLKEWPSKKRDRDAFIAWQLGKRLSVEMEGMTVSYRQMSNSKDEKLVLATAVPTRMLSAINALFENYHAMPEVISVSSYLKFDALLNKGLEGSGALVLFWHGYWSILVWDQLGRIRYQRSRWYRDGQDENAFVKEYFVFELERVIRGVMQQEKIDSVERILIGGSEAYVTPLINALDAEAVRDCSVVSYFSYINAK